MYAHAQDLNSTQINSVQNAMVLANKQSNIDEQNLGIVQAQVTSNPTLDAHILTLGAVNLGQALAGELGVHANSFGTGASAPIVRGQTGKRLTIVRDGLGAFDMSEMSPDHAVMVDSLLADTIEIVDGAKSLLYGAHSGAGAVQILQNPAPSDFISVRNVNLRTDGNEKLVWVRANETIGDMAFKLGAISKHANDLPIPAHTFADGVKTRLDNSDSHSRVLSLGASYQIKSALMGAAIVQRRDRYGLPAHNHLCDNGFYRPLNPLFNYLVDGKLVQLYPHLATDSHINYDNPAMICETHAHGNAGHSHQHGGDGKAYIDMAQTRYETFLDVPTHYGKWHGKVVRSRYRHDEKDGREATGNFANDTDAMRLEFTAHTLALGRGDIQGTIGISGVSSHAYATTPIRHSYDQPLLHPSHSRVGALFAQARYHQDTVGIEFGMRMEQSDTRMDYDLNKIYDIYCQPRLIGAYAGKISCDNYVNGKPVYEPTVVASLDKRGDALGYLDLPNRLAPKKHRALSYAFALDKDFGDMRTFVKYARIERAPTAQELYAHGAHLATNSFELGNNSLKAEKLHALSAGVLGQISDYDYQIEGYYHDYGNYIYQKALNDRADGAGPAGFFDKDGFKIYRYFESPARFYGAQGEISKHTAHGKISLGIDGVIGKLHHVPDVLGASKCFGCKPNVIPQPDGYAPKVPPVRAMMSAVHQNVLWGKDIEWRAKITHAFAQKRTARYERATPSYTEVALSAEHTYRHDNMSVRVFGGVDNLLNQKIYHHASALPYIPDGARRAHIGVSVAF